MIIEVKLLWDLWDLVKTGLTDTTKPIQFAALTNNQKTRFKEIRRKDAKAMNLIEAALTKSLFLRTAVACYSKETQDIHETTFKGTDRVPIVEL